MVGVTQLQVLVGPTNLASIFKVFMNAQVSRSMFVQEFRVQNQQREEFEPRRAYPD